LEARLKSNDQRRDSTDKEAEAHRKLIVIFLFFEPFLNSSLNVIFTLGGSSKREC